MLDFYEKLAISSLQTGPPIKQVVITKVDDVIVLFVIKFTPRVSSHLRAVVRKVKRVCWKF